MAVAAAKELTVSSQLFAYLTCVQFGSFVFVFCYLCVSAGLLCVLLLALPVPSLLLLLCCVVAVAAVHSDCRLRRPIARRLLTTAAAARAVVLLLLPLLAVLWVVWDAAVRVVPHCFCC